MAPCVEHTSLPPCLAPDNFERADVTGHKPRFVISVIVCTISRDLAAERSRIFCSRVEPQNSSNIQLCRTQGVSPKPASGLEVGAQHGRFRSNGGAKAGTDTLRFIATLGGHWTGLHKVPTVGPFIFGPVLGHLPSHCHISLCGSPIAICPPRMSTVVPPWPATTPALIFRALATLLTNESPAGLTQYTAVKLCLQIPPLPHTYNIIN